VFPWKEVVGREEIERMVREIMENKEGNLIRVRVKHSLNMMPEKALTDGGSSYNQLS
jgi:coniferyl-alcohol glucosyltransferase